MTEEIREKVAEIIWNSMIDRAEDDPPSLGDARKAADSILALVSPPLGGDLSARDLRSDADAATTGSDQGSDSGTTRARTALDILRQMLGNMAFNYGQGSQPAELKSLCRTLTEMEDIARQGLILPSPPSVSSGDQKEGV